MTTMLTNNPILSHMIPFLNHYHTPHHQKKRRKGAKFSQHSRWQNKFKDNHTIKTHVLTLLHMSPTRLSQTTPAITPSPPIKPPKSSYRPTPSIYIPTPRTCFACVATAPNIDTEAADIVDINNYLLEITKSQNDFVDKH